MKKHLPTPAALRCPPSARSDHPMETACTYATGSFEAVQCQAELCQLLAMQSR